MSYNVCFHWQLSHVSASCDTDKVPPQRSGYLRANQGPYVLTNSWIRKWTCINSLLLEKQLVRLYPCSVYEHCFPDSNDAMFSSICSFFIASFGRGRRLTEDREKAYQLRRHNYEIAEKLEINNALIISLPHPATAKVYRRRQSRNVAISFRALL